LCRYFNTVGSKEGWTPSTFVSSRSNRRKDDAQKSQHRPEDYMDEEDLEDAAEAQKLQTNQAFAGLGSSDATNSQSGGLSTLFRTTGDTIGLRLMRKMGWKDGSGVGQKIRRGARLHLTQASDEQTFLFAPDDVPMIKFVRKTDRKGLGHSGEANLATSRPEEDVGSGNEEADQDATRPIPLSKAKTKTERRGIGVGVLNDDGSDEDPYDIGPKIKYNRVIGGDKKKTAKKATVNPALKNAPVFLPKTARNGPSMSRCHDGRLPLDGFILSKTTEDFANLLSKYAPPHVPQGWKPTKGNNTKHTSSSFVSTTDAARASTLDPRSRAALLGEKALPGKSVFDFLSGAARDKLAAGSGKQNLPQAKGEIPAGFEVSAEDSQAALLERIPKLETATAVAALARGANGPYADDEAKRSRYREYLEHFANETRPMPEKLKNTRDDDYVKEMTEYANCAKIFKPMTGFMASRFTTGKSKTVLPGSNGNAADQDILSKPEPKVEDPAEEAARMGMFGKMTRSTQRFYPTRLLCKRFNVRPPEHSRLDDDAVGRRPEDGTEDPISSQDPTKEHKNDEARMLPASLPALEKTTPVIDPEKNDAVEGTAASAKALRAIFGDSDSE
jgi:G patch domain-containing protein 1